MTETAEKPNVIQRPRCPFYGFSLTGGVFIDQRGNQCPLREGYAPCLFVLEQKSADLASCRFYKVPGLVELYEDSQIFPREHMPANATSWEGIRFRDWSDYILHGIPLSIEV